ncbi:TPA: P-type DNA transfer ATPase VirB11 [Burkholderia cepacia]
MSDLANLDRLNEQPPAEAVVQHPADIIDFEQLRAMTPQAKPDPVKRVAADDPSDFVLDAEGNVADLRPSADPEAEYRGLLHRMRLLLPFMAEKGVEEIAVNETGGVWIMKSGRWEYRELPALDLDYLITLGNNLSSVAHAPFDRTVCSLSAFLPEGERIEMTHPPVCPDTTRYLNLRIPVENHFEHQQMVDAGYYARVRHERALTLSDEQRNMYAEYLTDEQRELWALATAGKWAEFMPLAVQYYQNILISGKTGSGKTSYLRALIENIDTDERVVVLQDTPETPLPNHPNRNFLTYKKEDGAREGQTAKQVLVSVMRKTPDRVIMQELRSDEAMYYLSGVLSSGHPGGLTTTHANNPKAAFQRVAMLIKQSEDGRGMETQDVMTLLYSTVDVVVQLVRDKAGKRYVPAIYYDPMYSLSLMP